MSTFAAYAMYVHAYHERNTFIDPHGKAEREITARASMGRKGIPYTLPGTTLLDKEILYALADVSTRTSAKYLSTLNL